MINTVTNQYKNAVACIYGHEFTEDNTYINPTSGSRQCKICMKQRATRYYRENKHLWAREYETLTIDRLREVLEYDKDTGLWRWLILPNNSCKKGWFNGHLKTNPDGYKFYEIRIDGITYIAARLAWFYMKGEWPTNKIDHKNRNSLDNKWENLREATNNQNSMNQKPRFNVTGYKGVSQTLSGKFSAYIRIDQIFVHLGTYNTAIEASYAYETVAKPLHGEFWYLRSDE